MILLFSYPSAQAGLDPSRLGVVFNFDDPQAAALAQFYRARRGIPGINVVGAHLGRASVAAPAEFTVVRTALMAHLPTEIQSIALISSRPFAVGCMSITSALAAGYQGKFCEPGCEATAPNPLFDAPDWLPADTAGWWPAMMIPTDDPPLARALIERGVAADGSAPIGTVYLLRTSDSRRNVRAATYSDIEDALGKRLRFLDETSPAAQLADEALGYFTGAAQEQDLARIHFRPGALADHLTSQGGVLQGGDQMSALAWLRQGATASYGTVTEPCNRLEKFPDIKVLLRHYLQGDTALEAYWKSVAMPGQGLFIGEPLARPFATQRR